jgi:fumarate hydratase subunit beta
MAKCVKKSDLVAYEDLGSEAIRKLEVENLPAVVAIDCYGNNLYEIGRQQYLEIVKK